MITKHFWKLFAVLAVLLIGGAFLYSNYSSNQANIGLTFEDHIKGNPDAAVTLTEYSDFQCPACQQFSTIVDEVLKAHEGKIRFEYKHFPLITIHQNSVLAARAAESAGQQGKFFEMHDTLFANQNTWEASANPQIFFNQYAQEIGLNVDTFKTHMRASAIRDRVMESYNAARELNLTGTPTFYLNGVQMEITTYEDFANQVAAAVGDGTTTEGAAAEQPSVDQATDQVQFGF